MSSPKWQYFLDDAADGESAGWHDHDTEASKKLEDEFQARSTKELKAAVWHLQCGGSKHEVNLATMTQRNNKSGQVFSIRRADPEEPPTKKLKTDPDDKIGLEKLFEGAPVEWREALQPALLSSPLAPSFVGTDRARDILPVRELTFQALKPNPPAKWKVICFGQNPYPRVESATGIAMFDATINSWESKQFGKASSMRCIIKAAAMAEFGVDQTISIQQLRAKLREWEIVSPSQWFQAMLSQGVLLLNAALSIGGAGKSKSDHVNFWKPVVGKIVETILAAKLSSTDPEDKAVVFLWWGGEAQKIKRSVVNPVLKRCAKRIAKGKLTVKHIDHCNPAAQGDKFCHEPSHFKEVNSQLGSRPIKWLPDQQWLVENADSAHEKFITDTKELHKLYLQRLQDGLIAPTKELEPIEGIMELPAQSLPDACSVLHLEGPARAAIAAVERLGEEVAKPLSSDEKAAVYLYTGNSLYRKLNEALRNPDREVLQSYRPYLRQFLAAFDRLQHAGESNKAGILYRGLNKDISAGYPIGATVTWWNVISTTPNKSVACGFGGSHGTLVQIKPKTAVPIMNLSAFQGEEEYVLAPGTRFKVLENVPKRKGSAAVITLEEIGGARFVN